MRALVHLTWLDPGFDVDRLFTVAASHSGEDGELRAREYWRLAMERTRGLPGVEQVALATFPPFATSVGDPTGTFENATDANYFAATCLRLLQGRSYSVEEVAAGAPVAVISHQIAARFWGDENPVGTSLDRLPDLRAILRGRTIIGVVADAQAVRLHDQATPFIYLPITSYTSARLVVRARNPQTLVAATRDTLATLSPSAQPTFMILAERYAREFGWPRRYAVLAGVIALLALGLAAVGLAGVTAFSVRCRTREIGIRLALGARRGAVIGQFVREGLWPIAIGLAVGFIGALFMGRLVAGLLHGVSAYDPLALASAVAVLLMVTLAAILVPVRRAVRLDPATILRDP